MTNFRYFQHRLDIVLRQFIVVIGEGSTLLLLVAHVMYAASSDDMGPCPIVLHAFGVFCTFRENQTINEEKAGHPNHMFSKSSTEKVEQYPYISVK